MSNDDGLGERVLAGGRGRPARRPGRCRCFRFYGEMIKSNVADMKNIGGTRYGGAITAAKFLEQFVGRRAVGAPRHRRAGLGRARNATRDAGGTGCFVRTLVELARDWK